MSLNKVAVIGLGKIGSVMHSTMWMRGIDAIGVDINTMYTCVDAAKCDAGFFIVPTPSNADGSFSNKILLEAMLGVATAVRNLKRRDYLFVVNSTTTPGSIDNEIIPALKRVLGKLPFGVCYNPEFVALGEVEKGLMRPDFVLIGESDKKSGERLQEFYVRWLCPKPLLSDWLVFRRMSIKSAELAKISVNAFITMKISFANQIGMLSRAMGADAESVLEAVGQDKRIGGKYFSAGAAFGGPCFPRDNGSMVHTASKHGLQSYLSAATDKTNHAVRCDLVQRIAILKNRGAIIAIVGFSYKPHTPVTEESPAVHLASTLSTIYDIRVFDPLADTFHYPALTKENVAKVDVAVIFHSLDKMPFKLPKKVKVIYP